MKISKPQQEVVDKMREGWELRCGVFFRGHLHRPSDNAKTRVSVSTISSLLNRKIIYNTAPSDNYHGAVYCLTEQYKTQPDSKADQQGNVRNYLDIMKKRINEKS